MHRFQSWFFASIFALAMSLGFAGLASASDHTRSFTLGDLLTSVAHPPTMHALDGAVLVESAIPAPLSPTYALSLRTDGKSLGLGEHTTL